MRPGWVRVDCHVHTVASGDSVLGLEELADRARGEGIDVVFVTDHHEISAAVAARGRDLGVRIEVGEEIRTPDGEVLGLFLTERIPYVLPLPQVVARIRAQGGLVGLPHPCDPARAGTGAVADGLCAAGRVDFVEVFNAKVADAAHNAAAAALAARHDLPATAGSDAHDGPGVGAAYVEMPEFDGPADFLERLAAGRVVGELRPHARRFPSLDTRRDVPHDRDRF
ncbi:MAG TPA: CehA/McbA family metallohydrolase [Pseudonocardia sp.]|uniref:CehA/McbA family metallohydrolase n=1 Tax=Pseudonocardia sp. TaxID=60912 RepID=UPI002B4AE32A|nr:CehA/McbA family metallohydrolase [Pseudonocardia sp.]HLU54251.1 CehA/McbA family metallohydrolase [Pseudonocardia sp.]